MYRLASGTGDPGGATAQLTSLHSPRIASSSKLCETRHTCITIPTRQTPDLPWQLKGTGNVPEEPKILEFRSTYQLIETSKTIPEGPVFYQIPLLLVLPPGLRRCTPPGHKQGVFWILCSRA